MITVNIKMNGYDYTMKKGITILDASFETLKMQREFMQQPIPTLYYLKGVQDVDMSGVCVAEVDGEIINASVTKIKDGMEIQTHTPAIMEARKKALAEILEKHNKSCLYCFRSTSCELQDLLKEYGFTDSITSTLEKDPIEIIKHAQDILMNQQLPLTEVILPSHYSGGNYKAYIDDSYQYVIQTDINMLVRIEKREENDIVEKEVTSNIYSYDDITSAINTVIDYFNENFKGCTLKEIYYAGDNENYFKEILQQYGGDEAIVLTSTFDVDGSGGDGSLNPNSTYKDWIWLLVRNKQGEWKHVDHGY